MQKTKRLLLLFLSAIFAAMQLAHAQYQLVWSDEFDGTRLDSNKWNIVDYVGIWNTGSNGELQHYKRENIEVAPDGSGNNCLIITAKKENYNGYAFTSGRLDTKGKFSTKYGAIEARIKTPDLANGLWPAFWMLGYNNYSWPRSGEIDILEMGHKDGITAGVVNKRVNGALHWDYKGSYAGYGNFKDKSFNANDDYHIYRLEWVPGFVRIYVDGDEYYAMNTSDAEASEFNSDPFFIILNLAVGGMFPDIKTAAGITAPLPAKMFVDYVRVYQKTNEGSLYDKPNEMWGNFGLYSETGQFNFKLDLGFDGEIKSQNLNKATAAAAEGNECLAYTISGTQNFELAINALSGRNMNKYANGSIVFQIKTNCTGDLTFEISDKNGQTAQVLINSESQYNFERTNEWKKVFIPVSAFKPAIDLTNLHTMFTIKGSGMDGKLLAVDNISWSEIVPSTDEYFGIFTENPNIYNKIIIDDQSVFLYIWNNNMTALASAIPYEGEGSLSFKVNSKDWYGYGIYSQNPVDLSAYKNGALHLSLKTNDSKEFWIGIGAASTEGKITFPASKGLYGFKRDGNWHPITIPMADLLKGGLDLSNCGNVFMLGGATITNIHVDDVYVSANGTPIDNPLVIPVDPGTMVKNQSAAKFRVFPNPASNFVEIEGAAPGQNIEIQNILGKTVLKTTANAYNVRLDIANLPSGVYFINLNANTDKKSMKFLKK